MDTNAHIDILRVERNNILGDVAESAQSIDTILDRYGLY